MWPTLDQIAIPFLTEMHTSLLVLFARVLSKKQLWTVPGEEKRVFMFNVYLVTLAQVVQQYSTVYLGPFYKGMYLLLPKLNVLRITMHQMIPVH